VDLEVRPLGDLAGEEEAAQQRDRADHQQAGGEDREHSLVEVVAEPSLQQVEGPDPSDRGGNAAGGHPPGERQVHRLQLQMAPAAGGLGDRGVEDVGADRGHRLDPEQQDQQRRHQGAAAHAGHADEEADAEAEEDDRWIHWRFWGAGAAAWTKAAFPTLFPFMTESVLKGAATIAEAALFPLIAGFSSD